MTDHKQNPDVKISAFVTVLMGPLFVMMDVLYGKQPTLGKFRVLEVIARIPYQSWEILNYFIATHFYTDEERAIQLFQDSHYPRYAQDNETMHVVVVTQLCIKEKVGTGFFRFHVIPILMAYGYSVFCTLFYFFTPRKSYELNYVFEDHARKQYQIYLDLNPGLREKRLESKFLAVYGRGDVDNYYDFFAGVRDDEIEHRDNSLVAMIEIDRRRSMR